ncbi:MAG: polysaccharide pyruvyl transferase family protein [Fibromonadaceae bacterium]|jgi:hypothetical protein|nr:polysaccharide pyruvyl transferase family protein [Fibromonadaceae bacterium]
MQLLFKNTLKTCTATFHYARNYGAFLQSYALQQFLGKSNRILDFAPVYNSYGLVGKKARQKLPFFWRLVALWRYFRHYYLRKISFNEFSMLNLTNKYSSTKAIVEDSPQANVYITGSDQVWNQEFITFSEDIYFLAFGASNAKRIAYAASMGMERWSSDFTQQILPHIRKFTAISVREDSSIPFLKSIGIENAVVTCDPTLLWTADFYKSHFPWEANKLSDYTFIYWLHGKIPTVLKEYKKKKDVITLIQKNSRCYLSVSIAQWLHYIDTANSVITNSFHGTIFSILFHKPFVVFPKIDDNQSDRITSLLKKMRLECRFLNGNETKEEIEKKLYRPIDWEQVDKILEEWRTYSENWLREALNDK